MWFAEGLVGDFVDERFLPAADALQVLDFGIDFYAIQSFSTGSRQIAFAGFSTGNIASLPVRRTQANCLYRDSFR
ncbi:hypothetical protein ACDY97_03410 [Rhizobium mongolense]